MKQINTYFLKGNPNRGNLMQLNQLVYKPSSAASFEDYPYTEMPETLPDPGPDDTLTPIKTTDAGSQVDS